MSDSFPSWLKDEDGGGVVAMLVDLKQGRYCGSKLCAKLRQESQCSDWLII